MCEYTNDPLRRTGRGLALARRTLLVLSVAGLSGSVALAATKPVKTAPAPMPTLSEVENKELVMFVGEIKAIPASKVSRIAIGNGNLVSTRFIDENQMLLIAESIGDTSLVLWTPKGEVQHYTIRVGSKDSQFAYRAAKQVLADIASIEIRPMGPNIAITGSAGPAQAARINALAGRYPQIIPLLKELDVEMKKMVYMKVQILEAKKDLTERLGVNWQDAFAGPVLSFSGSLGSDNVTAAAAAGVTAPIGVNGMRTYLGITSSIASIINLAKTNGDLTIIAEPELSARSGNAASFLAGGQVPITTAGALGTTNTTFKDYGIKLTIKPTADDSGNVIAAIKAELSQVDRSTAQEGTPGFLTRSAETEINVKSGQTMVISGLINRDMQTDVDAVPGLGNIPILGRLFRSDSFRGGRTDMLIAVTPVVVDATSTMNRERIEKSIQMKEDFERNLSKRDLVD